ncbi:MAG: cyclic nucleotide-binding domain-containing protein [Leptospiraceae bacterium]|nr:cyclic nucleotide-binding domain-containing protein [Leptospiraceae bacterium]
MKLGNRDPEQQELEVLKQIPVFDKLPHRALKLVRSLCHVRHFKEGEHVFRTNEPGVGMYIILEGTVEIYRIHGDSEEEDVLAEFYDGDFFGELALLDDMPRTASARAGAYSRMIGFFRPDLLSLMNRNPRIASIILLNIARITGKRLIRTNERLEECLLEAGKELV